MRMPNLLATTAPAATVLVRFIVGWGFLSEGILKFDSAWGLGVARFTDIGIPAPEIMAPFVGVVEIACGGLLIAGFLTRLAAVALWINISVAILSTKVPILLGHGYWGFTLPKLPHYGFWSMMHEARTDLSMWMGLLFLLIVGAGSISVDRLLTRSRHRVDLPK